MRSKKDSISGVEKVAILLNILGEEKACLLMKEMKDAEVRRVLNVMGQIRKAPVALVNSVLSEFLHRLSERDEILFDENFSSLDSIKKGLGEERAKHIFGTANAVNFVNKRNLTALDEIDADVLAEFLSNEHPQTIALILLHVDAVKQIAAIKLLQDDLRADVIRRMAELEYIAPDKVDELDKLLKQELQAFSKSQNAQLGGVRPIAELVNNLDKRTMNSILTRLEQADPSLVSQLRQYIFTFADIGKLDPKNIQTIVKEVPGDKLLLSLKGASEDLREVFYGSMSPRAAEMLKEDLEVLGPQKVADIESAQREIVAVVKRLGEEGKVSLGNDEDAEIIP